MTKGYEGLQQLLERGGIRFTGMYYEDMNNAKKMMTHEPDPLPMFSPKALYLGMQQTWLNRK
jgi:hypothetical protein